MEDIMQCIWEDYADEHLNTKDPYYEEINGKEQRRKLPLGATPQEQKAWKKIRNIAWKHDKCACGCAPVDCGLGKATLITIIPVMGPFLMYGVHARFIELANQELGKQLPAQIMAQMYTNILIDFLITLPPILGILFGYLHASSTRNAALIHTYMKKAIKRRQELASSTGIAELSGIHEVQQVQNPNDRYDEYGQLGHHGQGVGHYGRTTNTSNTRFNTGFINSNNNGNGKHVKVSNNQESGTY